MRPRRLRIKAIGPYRDVELDFTSVPGTLVAVTGLNGSGKTMLLECIMASIYRDFPSRPEGIYKYCTERYAGIEFEFEMAGKVYCSHINIDAKSRKMEAVLAHDKQPLNDGKTSTFDEHIEKILGAKDQILASSYGAQDKKGNFTELTKSKRKDLFIQMIGLQQLQAISDYTNKKSLSLEPEKTNLNGQIEILRATADKALPDLEGMRARLAGKRAELVSLQESLDSLSQQLVRDGARYEQLPDLQTQLSDGRTRLSAVADAIDTLTVKLDEAKRLYDLGPQLQAELETSRAALSGMRERIIVLREKSSRLGELQNKERSLKLGLEKLKADCNRLMLQIREQSSLAESLAGLREKSVELAKLRTEHEEASTMLRQLNTELVRMSQDDAGRAKAILEMRNKVASAERDEAEARKALERAQHNAKGLREVPCRGVGEYAACPLIKTAVESSGQIDDLTAKVDNCKIVLLALRQDLDGLPKPDEAGQKRVKAQVDEFIQKINALILTIKALEKEIEKLPAAETAAEKIETYRQSLSAAESARDAVSADIETVRAEIREIEAVKAESGTIEGEITKTEERIRALDEEVKRSQLAEGVITSTKADLERMAGERAELEKRMADLGAKIGELEALKVQYDSDMALWTSIKETNLPASKTEIDTLQSQLTTAETEAAAIAEAKAKLTQVEAQLNALTYRMACYVRVSKAFGPMEIQSFEIDSAGPEVSRLANELLFNCFGPRFSIRFVTQELKVDGKGYKDEFDVSVHDQKTGLWVSISDLSGGEKTIVSEALALGIALYNKEKNGVSWNTLFRDEVSGALDDVYAPQYIKMLRAARDMGHFQQVFFICHQERLKAMSDSKILVHNGQITLT
jgi:exonuclease SbcC